MTSASRPSATPDGPTVACPTCGAQVLWSGAQPYRPFCSERCRNVDLGAWASDEYRIPAAAPPEPGADGSDD